MSDSYHHGVKVTELTGGSRYLQTFRTSVIGMVGTAPDADDDVFPENVPTLITDIQDVTGKAGDAGTLPEALQAIAEQGNVLGVFIRVPEGQTEAETTSNIIGKVTANQQYTGLQALLVAQSLFGVTPRVLGAPGLDDKPVTTALVSIAQKLRAFAYARCHGKTVAEMLNYRKDFSARELMLIGPDLLAYDTAQSVAKDVAASAYALGLRAKIDSTIGWHKSLSNVAINGVVGISRDIGFNLQSSDTDAGLLNEEGITTLINYNGFRFWGSRTCDASKLFPFETSTRTAQIIADTIAENMFTFVDGVMSANNIIDIRESVNAKLREWTRLGYILGGECWYDPASNPKENLKNGIVCFDFDYTDAPPMESLLFTQRKTDKYFANLNQAVTQN